LSAGGSSRAPAGLVLTVLVLTVLVLELAGA
jgi:hypothetical protein